jgi:hypothetical protein
MKRFIASLVLCVASPVAAQVTSEDVEGFDAYVVKTGDTCTSIAKQFYGDVYAYDIIHAFNDLSASSYACVAGQTLQMPRLKPRPEAALAAKVGPVKSAPPQADWRDAESGMALFRAWKVNTLEKAKAELAFQDQSDLVMSENTLVVIYGPRNADALQRSVPRAEVERGRLKARLSQLSGGLDVDTPSAIAELESGEKQVSVEDDGTTRVENHSGQAVRVEGRGKAAGKKVSVKAGFGTRVVRDKAPEKPRVLPSTPAWTSPEDGLDLVFDNETTTLKAQWMPVKGAQRYHVELSRDAGALDVFFSGFVDADIHQVEIQEVPAGIYHATVAAVDADLFESVPSVAKKFRVDPLVVSEGGLLSIEQTPAIVLGSTLTAPIGRKCGFESPASRTELRKLGTTTITCQGGGLVASREVSVVPQTLTDAPQLVQAIRGQVTEVVLSFAPSRPKGLVVAAPDGVIANAFAGEGDTITIQVVPNADAGNGNLDLSVFGEPLGAIALEITEPVSAAAQFGRPPIWLTTMAGYSDFGPNLDLRAGLVTTPWFGGELRIAPGYYADDESFTMEVDGHVMLGWLDTKVTPHILGGLGLRYGFADDLEPMARLGAGVGWQIHHAWRLRGEVAANIIPEDDILGLSPGAAIGASYEW